VKFTKGNKAGKGGKRKGAGRPSQENKQIKKLATEIVQAWFEKNAKDLMDTYGAQAIGKVVTRHTPKGNKEFYLEVDSKTTRDAVGKLKAAAKQEIELSGAIKIVELDAFDPDKTE